jgi:hypothetical protein
MVKFFECVAVGMIWKWDRVLRRVFDVEPTRSLAVFLTW